MSDVKANIDKRTRQMDAKAAAKDADWAEADAADALDFADWAVENAQLAMLDAIHARAHADNLAKAADQLVVPHRLVATGPGSPDNTRAAAARNRKPCPPRHHPKEICNDE